MVQLPAPERRGETAGAALRTFFRIAEVWGLTAEQQMRLLGSPARSTYFRWKRQGAEQLSRDTLERISYVLGIYKALQVLLPDAAAADAWVRRPNRAPLFGGGTALDRMLTGNVSDLYLVRQYLDAQRAGWP
jgi:hypothetical protein